MAEAMAMAIGHINDRDTAWVRGGDVLIAYAETEDGLTTVYRCRVLSTAALPTAGRRGRKA